MDLKPITVNGSTQQYDFWDFKSKVDYVDQWSLMGTPVPLMLITASYLLFVLKLGPKLMNKRSAFTIRRLLFLYNVLQVGYSFFLLYIGSKLIFQHGLLSSSCHMDKEDTKFNITSSIYYYFFAKVTELMDTVFFVLKKNYRQVTFLHVYHHSLMIWCTWIALKYEPSYSTIFLGTFNSLVHIIMYSYYALSAFPDLAKYLWWKKYITVMQLIQFNCIILQAALSYIYSACPASNTLLYTIVFNSFLFIYLFGDFYVQAYRKPKYHNNTNSRGNLSNKQQIIFEEKTKYN